MLFAAANFNCIDALFNLYYWVITTFSICLHARPFYINACGYPACAYNVSQPAQN